MVKNRENLLHFVALSYPRGQVKKKIYYLRRLEEKQYLQRCDKFHWNQERLRVKILLKINHVLDGKCRQLLMFPQLSPFLLFFLKQFIEL